MTSKSAENYRRNGHRLWCIGCEQELDQEAFALARPYADGTERRKSRCRQCANRQKSERIERLTEERILQVEAPYRAAERLLREHPEAMADLVRRYYGYYVPLLAEEREHLLTRRRNYLLRMRANRQQARAAKMLRSA